MNKQLKLFKIVTTSTIVVKLFTELKLFSHY